MTGYQYENGPKYDKVILAVGSCENHGYHLPFATDTFVSSMLAEKIAAQVDGLSVLPPVKVGMSNITLISPSLDSETRDIDRDVKRYFGKHGP